MTTNVHVWEYLAQFFLESEIFQTKFGRNQNTYFRFNNFFSPENRAVYDILRKNTVEADRSQMPV
jgi:hypothetical protein